MSTVAIVPDDPVFANVVFDATDGETHTFTIELTKNPIETGGNVTDHLIKAPRTFECVVRMTNTPDGPTLQGEGIYLPIVLNLPIVPPSGAQVEIVRPLPTRNFAPFQIANAKDRIKRCLDQLVGLQNLGMRCTVLTARREYKGMIITGVTEDLTLTAGGQFRLSFEELQVVSAETVNAPKPKEPRGEPGQAKGSQATEKNPFTAEAEKFAAGMKGKSALKLIGGLIFEGS